MTDVLFSPIEIDEELKKQILVEFGHRCAICGAPCNFYSARIIFRNFLPKPKIDQPYAKGLICLCNSCLYEANKEKWEDHKFIEHKSFPWIKRYFSTNIYSFLPLTSLIINLLPNINKLSTQDQKFLQSALSAFLKIDPRSIQISSIKDTPIKVRIELPIQSAVELLNSPFNKNSELYKFLFPLPISSIGQEYTEMRWLTDDELNIFRRDYWELEKEIQSFFRAYYLSGLILIATWLLGQQSKPLIELSISNGGYSIYILLGLAVLNMAAITYLVHKSIAVHEIAHFITYLSKPNSVFNYWESWRRSSLNYGKKANIFFYIVMFFLSFAVSFSILFHANYILTTDPQILLSKIKEQQIPRLPSISTPNSTIQFNNQSEIQGINESQTNRRVEEERNAYAQSLNIVFSKARFFFYVVCILHLIPGFLLLINGLAQKKGWDDIEKLRGWRFLFKDFKLNPVGIEETLDDSNLLHIRKDSDSFISDLTETQLLMLFRRIKEEHKKNQ